MNPSETHNAIIKDDEELIPLSWTDCTPRMLTPQAVKYSFIVYESHTTNVTKKDDEKLVPLLWTCHKPTMLSSKTMRNSSHCHEPVPHPEY